MNNHPFPRIGLSSCFLYPDPRRSAFRKKTLLYAEQSMVHWIASGGALVYSIPTPAPSGGPTIDDWVDDLDGLVLHGGADVAPGSYDEAPLQPEWEGDGHRDAYECDLLHRFDAAGKPVLGICRGMQLMNVAYGGTLFQDLHHQHATDRAHRDEDLYDDLFHDVVVEEGSALAGLVGSGHRVVDSIHHQAVKDVAPGFDVEARSAPDGIVEAIRRSSGGCLMVGVQWHPEFFPAERQHLLDNTPVLAEFLQAARDGR